MRARVYPLGFGFHCEHISEHARLGVGYDAVGDLDTLELRLHDEVMRANVVVPWIGLVGAWCRKP